jgi:NTE family protein
MLTLGEIAPFSSLSPQALERLEKRVALRTFEAGTIVMRMGGMGQHMHAIASGAVRVQLDEFPAARGRSAMLGPGRIFGEMALLSGLPVSATVTAAKDTTTYCLDGSVFLDLLDEEPLAYRSLTHLLVDRLRRTSGKPNSLRPGVAVLAVDETTPCRSLVIEALFAGIRYYAPGSTLMSHAKGVVASELVSRWRTEAGGDQYLTLALPPDSFGRLADSLEYGDVVLFIGDRLPRGAQIQELEAALGAVDCARVYVPGSANELNSQDRWAFRVDQKEIDTFDPHAEHWTRRRYPTLDGIARYCTFREIGVALSVGAAAGFAHYGVLQTLEEADIPLDFLCGTSMGGVVALACARYGTAGEAGRQLCERMGANAKIRDRQFIPRASFFSGRKGVQIGEDVFGNRTFADLLKPAAVVSADLVGGEKVVIDKGSAARAAHATAAIPGLFPPLLVADRLLVDGGLVTRVPVDLLDRRRCGYRLAVNIVPAQTDPAEDRRELALRLYRAMWKPLGLWKVIGESWRVLGWWDAAMQAHRADMVVTVATPAHDHYNFDSAERMVELGRTAAKNDIASIGAAVTRLLSPGTP